MRKFPVFPIPGDHSWVSIAKEGKFKGLVERKASPFYHQQVPPFYSISMALAQVLFPRNFPKQISSSVDKKATYSRLLKLDEESLDPLNIVGHYQRVRNSVDIERLADKFRDAGIFVNMKVKNIGFKNSGTPVFFEVWSVCVSRLEETVRKMRSGDKKQQAVELVDFLKKNIPTYYHPVFYQVHKHSSEG